MTKIITSIVLSAIAIIPVSAQEQADSIAVQQLHEVVIQAPKVIRKADMDVYHPSESAVENSKNGMQLLRNLMIPTLSVNDALGTVTSGGQSVQVRINGREATIEQVQQLLPETIKRPRRINFSALGMASYSDVPTGTA